MVSGTVVRGQSDPGAMINYGAVTNFYEVNNQRYEANQNIRLALNCSKTGVIRRFKYIRINRSGVQPCTVPRRSSQPQQSTSQDDSARISDRCG